MNEQIQNSSTQDDMNSNEVMVAAEGDFAAGQIRLVQLSVCNWGSFDGLHTATIDPFGTLITGDNGSGKTTLIDGLMALLLPAGKATFNVAAAQGDRTDRSLVSYMRGSYGSAHDGVATRVKSKREGAVMTGLRALYQADDGSQITLAALFWIAQASNSLADVKRLYVVAHRDILLESLLDDFSNGDVRALKKNLKDDPLVNYCENNFTEYQEVYRRILHMDNKNAPALLSRALGLKKIDDLTQLIRELVLEPSTVKDDARKVVNEFGDLVTIHDQLVDAKERQEALLRLPVIEKLLQQAETELSALLAEREGLSIFIAEHCVQLWSTRAEAIKEKLERIAIEIEQLEEQEVQAALQVEQCHEAYIKAGGNRLEEIKKDLQRAKEKLEETSIKASSYQKLTADLELDTSLNPFVFKTNSEISSQKLNNLDAERKSAQDQFLNKGMLLSDIQKETKKLAETIKEIEARPDSSVDPRYQKLRDEMVNALGLNSGQCMFIGELVDVKDEHKSWQGAIERALGGFRTTLAVPQKNYYLVTQWLNQTHTGLHVRVQVVDESAISGKGQATFKTNGFLRKLSWRDHPYRDWVKRHLSRYDLNCVDSLQALDATPFSITLQGLIHFDKGRFEKKDQNKVGDRRKWQLGFSNKFRLSILKQDEINLHEKLVQAESEVALAREHMDDVETRAAYWEKLSEFQWSQIDVPKWKTITDDLKNTLYELEHSNNDLALTKKYWQDAKQKTGLIQSEKESKSNEQAVKKKEYKDANEKLAEYRQIANEGLIDSVRELLVRRVGIIVDEQLAFVSSFENKIQQKINGLHDKASGRKERATNEATGIMGAFRQRWEVIAGEWGASIQSLADYLDHLQTLQEEGLPSLVEQFKERLNRHTTQSIATIKSRIEAEREDITERIEIINKVLKRTEFRPGSYLKLGSKPEQFPHVKEFNLKVSRVLSQATSDDHELRFASLQEVVETLDRASAPTTVNNMESLRLLDPRHQLSFHAEEIETETFRVLDVLESSSGKSGGEKESFAGTIVAASLAYVLTPEDYDQPIYCTVFLDEAFSNTAEAVSRRVLRVFRELNIHVNLITPYKNLNLARESAKSLIIAERDQARHESRLCEVSWKEIDRRHEEQKQKKLVDEAESLGIVINE